MHGAAYTACVRVAVTTLVLTLTLLAAPLRATGDAAEKPLGARLKGDLRAAAAATPRARTWEHVGLGLLGVAAVSTADESLRTRIQDSDSASREHFAETLRPLGEAGGLALMAGAWGIGAAAHSPRLTLIGQDGLEATLFAEVLTGALKVTTGRARPREEMGSHSFHPFSGDQSFPSGEATEAFAIAAVVSHHSQHVWVRSVAWGLASVIAIDRMELDAHWASDVVAGGLIGGGVGHWLAERHDPLLVAGHDRRLPAMAVLPARGHGSEVVLAWAF